MRSDIQGRNQRKCRKKKPPSKYMLVSLNQVVDLTHLPSGYGTSHVPIQGLCDHCNQEMQESDGVVLICGHGYHHQCYNSLSMGCDFCEQYYKKGIFENVDSFVKRLCDDQGQLTVEDGWDNTEVDSTEDDDLPETVAEGEQAPSAFLEAIHAVESW